MAASIAHRMDPLLRSELERGVREGIFPGACACVGFFAGSSWTYVEAAAGSLGSGQGPVTFESVYDLASLTKPWVATTALRLHQRGEFHIDDPIAAAVSEARDLPVGDRTWEEALSHRAGFEAWIPFFDCIPDPFDSTELQAWVLADLLGRFRPEQVGVPVYSDLGYILAGVALERVAGLGLAELVTREVCSPLGIDDQVFFGAARSETSWKARCATTGWSSWRDRELIGEVNDDNCSLLGGVCGHAGLFGEARAVARFGAAQISALAGRLGALDEELVAHATARRKGGSHRLGWDGVSEEGSAAGSCIHPDAFGHLGFTGTSVWCDPHRQLVTVLLTNRVAVSDDNAAIRSFRPAFQDAVIGAFDGDALPDERL